MAWLIAKRIASKEDLETALRELGIDPDSFPQDAADAHLGSMNRIPHENHIEQQEVDPAAGSQLQAAPRKGTKRSSQTPT